MLNTQDQVRYTGKLSDELTVFQEALHALNEAREQYPDFPVDIVLATALVAEELGESVKSANDVRWSKNDRDRRDAKFFLRKELLQVLAITMRVLVESPLFNSEPAVEMVDSD